VASSILSASKKEGFVGYLHIDNLYKNQDILMFKECFALEKIHGTSAHVSFKGGRISFFNGGEKRENFLACFDYEALLDGFNRVGADDITIYGEAYGGKQQGMRLTYGNETRFVAFDVRIGPCWLSVPDAEQIVTDLNLEFVAYNLIPTTIEAIDAERDAPSVQSIRNGIGGCKIREGIVLRPPVEVRKNNGDRIIAKHKSEMFRETTQRRKVISPEKLVVLKEAEAIADEWVTHMRLTHVLQRFPDDVGIDSMGEIIKAMVEDVEREAKGEIVESKAARKAIGKRTAKMFNQLMQNKLKGSK
jgi:hypothetical protein